MEYLRTAATRQVKGRIRLSYIEATRSRLRQQLDAADWEALTPASAAGTPGIRYGATHNANNNPNPRQPGTFRTGSG